MKRRKDGYYQKLITVDGKKKMVYGKTEKEVEKKVYLLTERNIPIRSKKLFYWIDVFEDSIQHLSYNSIDAYKAPIKDVKEYFGNIDITTINAFDIERFINTLVDKGYARQTINYRLLVLKKTFKEAVKSEVMYNNPADLVELPRGLKQTERKPLSDKTVDKIKKSNDLLLYSYLYTGARRNEILALSYDNQELNYIDFENKTISINKQLDFHTMTFKTPKTKSGIRTIPLLEPFEKLLLAQNRKHGLVFHKDGKPLTKNEFRRLWENSIKPMDENFTTHQLRHSYATILFNAGIDAKIAQKILGHSKINVTLDIYTHIKKTNIDEATEKLNEFFK